MPKPSSEVQAKALAQVREYREESSKLSDPYRQRLLRVYRSYKTFKEDPYSNDINRQMRTDFKVNKAHEVVEKVIVRLIGKDPRWIVTPRSIAAFAGPNEEAVVQQPLPDGGVQPDFAPELKDRASEWSSVVQDYLTYIFDEYNLRERFKLAAKNLVVYGKTYAKTCWKYEVARVAKDVTEDVSVVDEDGVETEQRTDRNTVITEEVIGQYPSIDVISWTDMYYDPRYIFLDDRPAMVEYVEGVRYANVLKDKQEYINLDELKLVIEASTNPDLNAEMYKQRVRQITGIMSLDPVPLKKNSLNITKYYGVFSPTEEAKDEKMYEIWTVNDTVCIKYKEITRQPIQEAKCFDDPETAYATGFVEPILSLQEEMNWKKNSASEYINQMITRRFIWSPFSGINPKDVMNPIIPTTKTGAEAVNNFPELKLSEINPSYFQEQNDFERQIQAMSFTVDTSNPRSENALTNTATGARIKFFESNSVLDEVRKVFEKFLERVAYNLLLETFENLDENIVFKKQGTEEYWNVNKEFLRNAIQRYSIKVETNSSSFNDIESRREDAIALFNIALQAQQAGASVDLTQIAKDIFETFEKRDVNKYIKPASPQQIMSEIGMGSPTNPLPQPEARPSSPAQLTEQVAQGGLTSLVP